MEHCLNTCRVNLLSAAMAQVAAQLGQAHTRQQPATSCLFVCFASSPAQQRAASSCSSSGHEAPTLRHDSSRAVRSYCHSSRAEALVLDHHLPHAVTGRPADRHPWLAKTACLCLLAIALVCILPSGPASASQRVTSSGGFSLSGALKGILSFALHLDKHLEQIITTHGQATYAMLFAIVFAETGFVLTPFLPGDSLLFAAGAFSTPSSPLSFPLVLAIFLVASILGDAVNYAIGSYSGQKALSSKLIKPEYITKTQAFYARYGGKTIVLARFVPIVRTFAPFIAGVAKMSYGKFAAFNIGGAVLWTTLFTGAGYYFGNLPFVKENFTVVILGIVLVSVVPVIVEIANERRKGTSKLPPGTAGVGS